MRELLAGEPYRYVAELKLDGLSHGGRSIETGVLRQAVTRGDGQVGEDVTENARTIRTLPLQACGDPAWPRFEVRGEVHDEPPSFERLNAERDAAGPAAVRQSAQRRRRLVARAGTAHHGLAQASNTTPTSCSSDGQPALPTAIGSRSNACASWASR